MNYDDKVFSKIDLIQKGGKRGVKGDESCVPLSMKKAYSSRIPISREKYEDLVWMCERSIISPENQEYFQNLPHEDDEDDE